MKKQPYDVRVHFRYFARRLKLLEAMGEDPVEICRKALDARVRFWKRKLEKTRGG